MSDLLDWGYLNLASILLGLAAWALPAIALGRRRWPEFCMASLGCCALALLGQIYYQWHRVEIEDFSALMDTARAVAEVSKFLVMTTFAANVVCCLVRRKWEKQRRDSQ